MFPPGYPLPPGASRSSGAEVPPASYHRSSSRDREAVSALLVVGIRDHFAGNGTSLICDDPHRRTSTTTTDDEDPAASLPRRPLPRRITTPPHSHTCSSITITGSNPLRSIHELQEEMAPSEAAPLSNLVPVPRSRRITHCPIMVGFT